MMLEKFIEAERIEQMNATKRRRKLLEHRREVNLRMASTSHSPIYPAC